MRIITDDLYELLVGCLLEDKKVLAFQQLILAESTPAPSGTEDVEVIDNNDVIVEESEAET